MKKHNNDYDHDDDDDNDNTDNDKINKNEQKFLDYFENFIIHVIDDSLIEKLLLYFIMNENIHENDKKMIKFLIENDKQMHFIRLRYLFLVNFILCFGYFIDDTEDKIILKLSTVSIVNYSRPRISKIYRKYDKKTMMYLENKLLNIFNKNVKYIITKNIEINNEDDHLDPDIDIKNIYLESYNNILIIYEYYTKLVREIFELIILLILLTVRPFFFKSKYGLKRDTFNIIFCFGILKYAVNFFSDNDRFYKNNKINKEEYKIKNNILDFFKNINIIIENNTIDKELDNLLNHLSSLLNTNFLKKYTLGSVSSDFVKKVKSYKLFATFSSLIINETSLTQYLGLCRMRVMFYADAKYDLYKKLHITRDIIDIINEKPYHVAKTISWKNNNEYAEYVFVLQNITLEYGTKNKVLENVSLNFELGKSHFIYGNSGCGKTTLLNALMKRIKIENGVIKLFGIHEEYTYFSIRKYITYIASESALFFKDLYYNITYGVDEKKIKEKEIMEEITKYMTLFSLGKFIPNVKTTNTTNLSKGQTQRVAIIRLFIDIIFNDRRILFLDEFTSNIDNKNEKIIYTELRNLQKIYNFTVFYVSHNLYNIKYSDYNYEIDTETHSIQKNIT